MLLKICCVAVLLALRGARGDRLRLGHEGRLRHGGQDSYGDYEGYHEDSSDDFDSVRAKRFERKPTGKTLSPREIQEVRGAINHILSGHNQGNPFTPLPPIQTPNEKRSISAKQAKQKPRNVAPPHENYIYNAAAKFNEYADVITNTRSETQTLISEALSTDDPSNKPPTLTSDENYDIVLADDVIGATTTTTISTKWAVPPNTDYFTKSGYNILTTDEIVTDRDVTEKSIVEVAYEAETYPEITGAKLNSLPIKTLPSIEQTDTRDDVKSEIDNILGINNDLNHVTSMTLGLSGVNNYISGATIQKLPTRSHLPDILKTENPMETPPEVESKVSSEVGNEDDNDEKSSQEPEHSKEKSDSGKKINVYPDAQPEHVTELQLGTQQTTHHEANEGQQAQPTKHYGNKQPTRSNPGQGGQKQSTPAKKYHMRYTRPTRTTTITTINRTTTTKFQLDVPALLAIRANLTYDHGMNLTGDLNKRLLKYKTPTSETQKKGVFKGYKADATATIVAKCFVCGLDVENIPYQAHCADAFSSDFLPMVPVDMTTRTKASNYRKYCRFANIPNYKVDKTLHSVFGRWSGGCSVRWIDVSGVYTQRSCRSRQHAVTGRHFASERMARLEMALSNVENGCIISPMASLVPLSRAISLYARFHACVCTGSWCNPADPTPWITPWSSATLLLLVATFY